MPNVLDIEPMRAFARRASAKIGDPKVAARFERLAFERLLGDPRNFRPARASELENAPEWAEEAIERGETLCVFTLNRAAAARIHLLARRLDDTRKIATTNHGDRPRDAMAVLAARGFLEKIERASFDVIARKALYFSRLLAAWANDCEDEPVCPGRIVASTHGRVWSRITSVAQLRGVGREFRNCLARISCDGSYGAMLIHGMAQFWVLRDQAGVGLIVVMAPAPEATHFMEIRGPRNAPIFADHIDLVRLAQALGMLPGDPPPPPASDGVLALPPRRRRSPAASPSQVRMIA